MAVAKGAQPGAETAFGPKASPVFWSNLAQAFAGVADGLQHAHSRRVIHRDIKPSNLILDRDVKASASGRSAGSSPPLTLRILDFGVARMEGQESLTGSGDVVGTLLYMSPEQALRSKITIDHRTDIYSLGATMYEMLSGRPPFEGKSPQETLSRIIAREPVEPRKLAPGVPKDLETIVLKCLRKEPPDRYGTAEALEQDLWRFVRGDQIEARPQSRWEREAARLRAHKALAAAALAILLLASLGAWIGMVLIWREQVKTTNALKEVLRLSDVQRLTDCRAEAERLWPCVPEKVPEMDAWLAKAGELAGRLETHRLTLEGLRKQALPPAEGPAKTAAGIEPARDTAAAPPSWTFPDAETEWRHDVLAGLVQGIEDLARTESGLIADVERRLAFSRTVRQRSIEDHREEWRRAIESIADTRQCPLYGGLRMAPQVGLVPIGQDPDSGSGLWEFAHIQTGEIPRRREDGSLDLTEETGLVLVLIPGGTFAMGAVRPGPGAEGKPGPNIDPSASNDEGPVHDVILEPFFISKYEMTQGQWLRFTGENPSIGGPSRSYGGKQHSLLHPVEQVSREMGHEVLGHLGLALPTEAQWEYAARAGTTTVWWTGDDKESLRGAANLSDKFCEANGGDGDWKYEMWLDDGYLMHAPVGRYRANRFGLHDVVGNVFEWCGDQYGAYSNPVQPGTGERRVAGSTSWPLRGGSWNFTAVYARSACRADGPAGTRYRDLGVRPARAIEK
jgi:formylglycine-generating enzyme required for sulfatase activity